MKLLFALILLPATVLAQKPKKVTQYHYKQLKSAEGYMQGGKKTGEWTFWNKFGQLTHKAAYANDTLNGAYTAYREVYSPLVKPDVQQDYDSLLKVQQNTTTADIRETGQYLEGKKTGRWVKYRNNKPETETYYTGDLRNGMYIRYSQQGDTAEVMTYSHNELNGPYQQYYGGRKSWYSGTYKAGKKHGEWHETDGEFRTIVNYNYDTVHGPYTRTHYRQDVKTTGAYAHGVMHGRWRTWRNGILESEMDMAGGMAHGEFINYPADSNGVHVRGFYKYGNQDSICTSTSRHETCTAMYKNNEKLYEDCKDKNGRKTHSYKLTPTGPLTTVWNADGSRQENLEAENKVFITLFNAKGKMLKRTVAEPEIVMPVQDIGYTDGPMETAPQPEVVETVYPETPPQYPGGAEALRAFIAANRRFPEVARETGHAGGNVYITFTVTETGKVINPRVRRGLTPDLDYEALRLVKLMTWEPAMLRGKPVSAEQTIPVKLIP